MRRRTSFLLTGVLLVGVVPAAVALRSGEGATTDGAPADPATATVARRDLAERADVSGTLGYGDARELAFGGGGTVTALPAEGETVDRGGRIGEVDGVPVHLLFGERPLWRRLGPGTSDGADVAQLEANLVALGVATARQLGTGGEWTTATTAAVKRWQQRVGVERTGTIELGRVVFAPGGVRVAEHVVDVGAAATGPVLRVTATAQVVDVDLAASRQSLVKVGDAVAVVLPDEREVAGRISAVGAVAEATSDGGDPTVPVQVTLDDAGAARGLDEAPVTVRITTTAAEDVLAVPVQALLALAEGGYAVEVVGGPGTRLVGVEVGAAADGWVEIRGEVEAGDEVVTAR